MFARADAPANAEWSSTEYRRRARHLRKLYADEPARLHSHLGQLAKRHDAWRAERGDGAPRRSPDRVTVVRRRIVPELHIPRSQTGVSDEVVERFSQYASTRIDGPVLRYSERMALLRTAQRMGIGRFHANLLIAMAQHHASAHLRSDSVLPRGRHRFRWALPLAIAIVVQALVIGSVWAILST